MTTVGRTPSQTVGPFFSIGLCREEQHEVVPGGSVQLVGQVLDGAGDPVPDAVVELWQRGKDGTLWGRFGTDAEGRFQFTTEEPADGYVVLLVFARGLLKHVATRCYLPGAGDQVLDAVEPPRRETLVARREGDALRFDVHLQGERETVFFDV
jgi:protocatechuate 3,4-dioxygenase alpha subunit